MQLKRQDKASSIGLETKAPSDLRVVATLAAAAEKATKKQEIELRQLVKVPWFKSV